MNHLDKEILINLSKLCRIHCSDEELHQLQENLESILKYIEQMSEVETQDIPPCTHISQSDPASLRADEVELTLDRKTFLQNSPSHVGGMIRVPTVIKF